MKTSPNPFDVKLGARIKYIRSMHGLSQKSVANHLGITFQQVQKYEIGVNRLSVRSLMSLKSLFNIPITEFFPEGEKENIEPTKTKASSSFAKRRFISSRLRR